MPTERARLLELALESLLGKKNQIDLEISEITRELEGGRAKRAAAVVPAASVVRPSAMRKRSRFSREERQRRSARMKAYWENWRKQRKQKNQ